MCATERAPRGPFDLLERRYGLAKIVERGAGVPVKRPRVSPPSPADASDSDDDRPITELFGNAPPGRFDQFAFREASAPRAPRPEVEMMSVGAMRSLIASAGLSSADCVEKSELRARSVLALERLAEAKRLRDARA